MDTELWLITGAMVVFFAQWLAMLWAQNKITRLESQLRALKWEGTADDITAIGECAGDDNLGQLFEERK